MILSNLNSVSKPTDTKVEVRSPQEANASGEVSVKDFKGVAYPMNFAKTKIEFSPLKSVNLLEIWFDHGQPIQKVPGWVRNEGHEVVSLVQVGVFWKVLIKMNCWSVKWIQIRKDNQ